MSIFNYEKHDVESFFWPNWLNARAGRILSTPLSTTTTSRQTNFKKRGGGGLERMFKRGEIVRAKWSRGDGGLPSDPALSMLLN